VTQGLEWEEETKDTAQKPGVVGIILKCVLKIQNSSGYECRPVAVFVNMVIKVCLEWKTLK